MVRISKVLIAVLMVILWQEMLCGSAFGEESLFPAGYNIVIGYSLDTSDYSGNNIIHVHRSVRNNEAFALTGFYLTETMRNWATIESFSIDIDGIPVESFYTGASHDEMAFGYDTYRWVIDFPGDSLPFNRPVQSGERVNLYYDIQVNPSTGVILPFHTACFYGSDNGFFTMAEPIFIPPTVGCGSYVIGDWNGNGAFNVADIILAIGKLKGQSDNAALLCECPPGSGNIWAVAFDLNGNCAFNLADIIWGFGKLQGQPNILSSCPDCPPGSPSPPGIPDLRQNARKSSIRR